jgi:sensor histidine kinase regulating citrate/malate metabolism
MNLTILIILCAAITLALIIFPLIISYQAEKSKKQEEWDKIASYGKKINEKSRKNKLH